MFRRLATKWLKMKRELNEIFDPRKNNISLNDQEGEE